MIKRCNCCKKEKPLSEFYKSKLIKGGFDRRCKKCDSKLKSKRYFENAEYYRKLKRERYKERLPASRELNKKLNRRYYLKNLQKVRKRQKEWIKEWRKKNPLLAKEQDKKKHIKYRDRRLNYNKNYTKHRLKTDIKFKLRRYMSQSIANRLRHRLSSKGGIIKLKFLPYTIPDLMQHLESKFIEGMSWDNYGKWHIDHKIPDCKFNYKYVTDKEFQESWSLSNLQPLWAKDNLSKGGFYES